MAFPKINISPSTCILWAVMLLIFPLRFLLAGLLAGAVHELCHILAIHLSGGRVWSLSIGTHGAVIEATPMERKQELICAAAGPVGAALLLLPLIRFFPCTALCAAVQSVFNLLPIYPMDGGRILRCAMELIFGTVKGERISSGIGNGTIFVLLIIWIYLTIRFHLGMIPVLLLIFAVGKHILGKIPCKRSRKGLQ